MYEKRNFALFSRFTKTFYIANFSNFNFKRGGILGILVKEKTFTVFFKKK